MKSDTRKNLDLVKKKADTSDIYRLKKVIEELPTQKDLLSLFSRFNDFTALEETQQLKSKTDEQYETLKKQQSEFVERSEFEDTVVKLHRRSNDLEHGKQAAKDFSVFRE